VKQWSSSGPSVLSVPRGSPSTLENTRVEQPTSFQKRSHETAFSDGARKNARPPAAPAVPSFTAGLADLLASKTSHPSPQKPQPTPKDKPRNALGLTPSKFDESASEDEDDTEEETRLANDAGAHDLQFSYRGRTAALRTPAEIAAWIAERKSRFPTQAKREAAQKEAEEKRKRWEAEKQARAEASKQARERRQPNRKLVKQQKPRSAGLGTSSTESSAVAAAKLNAERLRRKALKAQRDLEAAEKALDGTDSTNGIPNIDAGSDDDSLGTVSDSSVLSSDASLSSSEFESDDDSPPEQQSSKSTVLNAFVESSIAPGAHKKPCSRFLRTGTCPYGARCRYSHDRSRDLNRTSKAQPPAKATKKGLFQVMVEKEQEQDQRKVLAAIIALGQQGILADPTQNGR